MRQIMMAMGGFSQAANAVFVLFPTLTKEEKEVMAPFIDSQVSSGNWALIDDFSHIGLPTLSGLQSWKKGKTAILTGAPPFVSGLGYTFSLNKYYDTGFNLSTDTTQYTLNDCGIDVDCYQNNEAVGGYDIFFANDGASAVRFTRRSTGTRRLRMNSAANVDASSTDPIGTGLMSLYKPNLSNALVYAIQNVVQQSLTNVSSTKTNGNLILNGGTFTFDGAISSWVVRKNTGFNLANYLTNLSILDTALAAL